MELSHIYIYLIQTLAIDRLNWAWGNSFITRSINVRLTNNASNRKKHSHEQGRSHAFRTGKAQAAKIILGPFSLKKWRGLTILLL